MLVLVSPFAGSVLALPFAGSVLALEEHTLTVAILAQDSASLAAFWAGSDLVEYNYGYFLSVVSVLIKWTDQVKYLFLSSERIKWSVCSYQSCSDNIKFLSARYTLARRDRGVYLQAAIISLPPVNRFWLTGFDTRILKSTFSTFRVFTLIFGSRTISASILVRRETVKVGR